MLDSELRETLFAQFSRVGKALSNSNRLELLELLAQGERSVDSLAKATSLTVANTSQHLQQLRQSGLVGSRKAGQQVYYRLNGSDVFGLLNALLGVAKNHLAEVDRLVDSFMQGDEVLEPLQADELMARIQEGDILLLDVRTPEEFAGGHLPGAVNVPISELESRLANLPDTQEIVAYCRGPYCIMANHAINCLQAQGMRARRLAGGYPGWRDEGFPVENGAAK